jgi:hypothetical protein
LTCRSIFIILVLISISFVVTFFLAFSLIGFVGCIDRVVIDPLLT